jgi:hypothetical protein
MRFIDRLSAIAFDLLEAAVLLLTTTNGRFVIGVGLASPRFDGSSRR